MLTIVYAVTAQVSIGKMLIAGLVPGLMLASLYIAYILAVARLKPDAAPLSEGYAQWPERGMTGLAAMRQKAAHCPLLSVAGTAPA